MNDDIQLRVDFQKEIEQLQKKVDKLEIELKEAPKKTLENAWYTLDSLQREMKVTLGKRSEATMLALELAKQKIVELINRNRVDYDTANFHRW